MSDTFIAVSNATAALYSIEKGNQFWKENLQVNSHSSQLTSATWLRNGRAVVITQGSSVLLHVLESSKEADNCLLHLPAGELLARITGDGKTLVLTSSAVRGTVHAYDVSALLGSPKGHGAAAVQPAVLRDHEHPIVAVAASSYTHLVATSSQAGTVFLHEIAPGGKVSTVGALPGGAALAAPKRCLAFSTTNPLRLAAGTDDGQVLVWQLNSASTTGPVVQKKLNGRVLGVGFATYSKSPSTIVMSCSEEGQLCATDVRLFPKPGESIVADLGVKASCMAVRDDGQVVAIGTKDGKIGVIKVEDFIRHRQQVAKLGCIKVYDMGTFLNVSDIAFQRGSSTRDSREGTRDSREGTIAPAAPPQPSASTSGRELAANASAQGSNLPASGQATAAEPGSGAPPALREATNQYAPRASSSRQPGGGGADGVGGGGVQAQLGAQDAKLGRAAPPAAAPGPGPATSTAAPAGAPSQQQRAVPADLPGVGPGSAEATAARGPYAAPAAVGPSGQASSSYTAPSSAAPSLQPGAKAGRPLGIPQIAVPISGQARPPDGESGRADGMEAPSSGAAGASADTAGPETAGVPSPVARVQAADAAVSASTSISPSRLRSPRVSTAGQIPASLPAPRVPNPGGAGTSTFAELLAQLRADIRADVRAEVSEVQQELSVVRQETRRLIHGLHTDIVRYSVAGETHTEEQVAMLRLENQQLREELRLMREQLELALRFGMLGQQRTNWG